MIFENKENEWYTPFMPERFRSIRQIPQKIEARFKAHPVRTSLEGVAAYHALVYPFYTGIDLTMHDTLPHAFLVGAEATGYTDAVIGLISVSVFLMYLTDVLGKKIEQGFLRRDQRRAVNAAERIIRESRDNKNED